MEWSYKWSLNKTQVRCMLGYLTGIKLYITSSLAKSEVIDTYEVRASKVKNYPISSANAHVSYEGNQPSNDG